MVFMNDVKYQSCNRDYKENHPRSWSIITSGYTWELH
jgi:hypothetical protein